MQRLISRHFMKHIRLLACLLQTSRSLAAQEACTALFQGNAKAAFYHLPKHPSHSAPFQGIEEIIGRLQSKAKLTLAYCRSSSVLGTPISSSLALPPRQENLAFLDRFRGPPPIWT